MDPQVQASFIPKRSLDTTASRGTGYGLFFLLAILIFIASVASAAGSFLYKQYLITTLEGKKESLKTNQGAFDPETIQNLARMDQRINQSMTLMAKHIAPSAVFALLSKETLEQVSFDSYSFVLQSDGSAKIDLIGKANSFSTVALQSDQFGASKSLRDVVFSGITVDQMGFVSFAVSATVDASLLSYPQYLKENAPTQ